MPALFLDTPDILPLPSLQSYTTISVFLLSCSIYYAFQVTMEPDWKLNATLSVGLTAANPIPLIPDTAADSLQDNSSTVPGSPSNISAAVGFFSSLANHARETSFNFAIFLDNPFIVRLIDVVYLMFHEPLCVWTLINMAYCCLILVGKFIQKLVFGELRVSEQQHLKDRFWNFVFYKFIFIFGVMNVQFMDEVVLWCSWFSILGFLSLLAQLCKDRFEYLSFSPMTPKWTHIKLLLLLMAILASSFSLFIVCVLVGIHAGINTFAFMAAECSLVAVRTLYVMVRYAIHLWDLNHEGVWENRASCAYYTELLFELATLTIDFFHHLHMLVWGNIILSMASLVILMQLRYLFYEMKRRIRKHKNYLQVVRLMEANFPMATTEELEKNSDDCAICWDRMENARKLPCGHLFHNSCLRSWLEQDTSCPTCRTSLKNRNDDEEVDHAVGADRENNGPNRQHAGQRTNHFFHFDGSRYASWLPSVSVEVTRPHLINIGVVHNIHTPTETTTELQPSTSRSSSSQSQSQIEPMARQVHEWFPHVSYNSIVEDIRITRSAEATIENILDGRLASESPSRSSSSNSLPSSSLPSLQPLNDIPQPQRSDLSFDSLPSTSSIQPILSSQNSRSIDNLPLLDFESMSFDDSSLDDSSADSFKSESPSQSTYAGRFSKSSMERHKMLSSRKNELLRAARRNFLARKRPQLNSQSTPTNNRAPSSFSDSLG